MHSLPFAFEGVVRLTKIGTVYLTFTVVIGFAALNTGNNALYIGLTFMLGCLLLSGIASKGGLKHLEIELRGIDEAWAGRPVAATLRIRNRSRIWSVRDVVVLSDEMARAAVVPLVPKRTTVEIPAEFLFERRGLVSLRRADFYTRYPFGFFLKKRRVGLVGEVVVFPRLRSEPDGAVRFRPVAGDEAPSNRPGPGDEVHSFRDYVRGDSLRRVHWKKSASLGRWITKQTEMDAARAVHVAVDPWKPRGTPAEAFEEMISAAATFVHDAVRRGLDVVLELPRVTLRARESQSANALFRALALIEPVHEPVEMLPGRDTVVFSLRSGDAGQTA
ncbi:MAG TPA: DUF58 domain-containing protein [Thermoanaerobaculia bacterium]|nr:DUF58 domain-containing protein [Thermoanaerobaculia bacterium]